MALIYQIDMSVVGATELVVVDCMVTRPSLSHSG